MKQIDVWLIQLSSWLQEGSVFPKQQRDMFEQLKHEAMVLKGSASVVLYRPLRTLFREVEQYRTVRYQVAQASSLINDLDAAGLRNDDLTKLQREMNQLLGDVEAGDSAFLEFHQVAPPCGEQVGGQLAHVGLVADEAYVSAGREPAELGQHVRRTGAGGEGFHHSDAGAALQPRGEQLGRLPGADERAGPDLVHRGPESSQHLRVMAHLIDPLGGQGPIEVVAFGGRRTLHGNGMSDQV